MFSPSLSSHFITLEFPGMSSDDIEKIVSKRLEYNNYPDFDVIAKHITKIYNIIKEDNPKTNFSIRDLNQIVDLLIYN